MEILEDRRWAVRRPARQFDRPGEGRGAWQYDRDCLSRPFPDELERWTVQPFLDARITVLNKTLGGSFRRLYPASKQTMIVMPSPSQRDGPHDFACSPDEGGTRPRSFRGAIMERTTPTRADDLDRLRLPATSTPQQAKREKESRRARRDQRCRPSAVPSSRRCRASNSTNDVRTAEGASDPTSVEFILPK